MKTQVIFMVICLMVMQACAIGPRVRVNIDSISDTGAEMKNKYILLPGLKDLNEGDLQYREYAAYVERGIIGRYPSNKLVD
jgi:hypothetical protein